MASIVLTGSVLLLGGGTSGAGPLSFALTVAAQILGVPAEYGQLRFTSPSGNNELGILRAAKDLGLKSKIVETKINRIQKIALPAIAILAECDFLVIIRADEKKILATLKADGTSGKTGEYSLTSDTVHSAAANAADEEYSEAIKAAPDLAGQGNVVNLRRAVAEDKTGLLYNYVQKFIAATRSSERMDWLDKILFKWTGTENINKSSRGSYADAQKLGTLEKLYGQDFMNVYGDSNPNYQNIWEELNKQYVSIRDKAYAQLAMQTFAKEVCDNLRIGLSH